MARKRFKIDIERSPVVVFWDGGMESDERMTNIGRASRILLSILLSALGAYGPRVSWAGERPNLLLITIDTLRADRLGCYGADSPATPRIDELARRGRLFSRAFANASTTLASHADILLGLTPNAHGVHENLNFVVSGELLTLAEYLKSSGYATGAFVGAYPLDSRFGLSQGFDTYDDHYDRNHRENYAALERRAEDVVGPALEWLKGRRSPWFLWVHCWDPHIPYDPPEPFRTRYKGHPYEGEVAYVDAALGKVFDHLKENGLGDSTLVVLTGDHGESLGQHGEKTHGFFAYNSTLRVPLIFAGPGLAPGLATDYVSHVDIFPTICDLLGVAKPRSLQGLSLLPSLEGRALPERPIYFESLYPYYSRGWAPLKGLIFGKAKFIESPVPELYDLERDFDELENLAGLRKTDELKSRLAGLIGAQTPSRRVDAAERGDRETRERLASLGYVSNSHVSRKKTFGVQDDVKTLLPYLNKADRGWQLYLEGRTEAAVALLRQVIAERAMIDQAYKNLADIYRDQGRVVEAVSVLERGLAALPSSYDLFVEYTKALIAARRYGQVISAFESARLMETEFDPGVWNNLGAAYAGAGRFEEAIKAYEMALALDARLPEANNNLANACLSLGLKTGDDALLAKCLEFYKRAIALDPGYPAPYHGLGHAYSEQGNLGGAIACWEQALEADPDFDPALFDLAAAYLDLGEKAKAFERLDGFARRNASRLSPREKTELDALLQRSRR